MEEEDWLDAEIEVFSALKFDHLLVVCTFSILIAVLPVSPNEKKTLLSVCFPFLYIIGFPVYLF